MSSTEDFIKAVEEADLSTVKKQLLLGADADTKDSQGTPLINVAATKGSLDVVKTLVLSGADANATDSNGNTAFLAAIEASQLKVIQYLYTYSQASSAAKKSGCFSCKSTATVDETATQKKIDLTITNKNGETPLAVAERVGTANVITWLKKHGFAGEETETTEETSKVKDVVTDVAESLGLAQEQASVDSIIDAIKEKDIGTAIKLASSNIDPEALAAGKDKLVQAAEESGSTELKDLVEQLLTKAN